MSARLLATRSRHLLKSGVVDGGIHILAPKISEAERIAARLVEDAEEAREKRKREPGPVTIRRFSWERDDGQSSA